MKIQLPLMIAALLVTTAASSAESMRCGNRVVTHGDPKAKVAELCGQPTQTEQRTVYRSGIPRRRLRIEGDGLETLTESELALQDRSFVEVQVDVWLYNRGNSRLMREIVFHDNRLVEVNVLGRGF